MKKQWLMVGMILLLVLWLSAGCGISQEVYDSVVSEVSKAQQELESAKAELESFRAKNSELISSFENMKSELESAQAELETALGNLDTEKSKVLEITSNLEKTVAEQENLQSQLDTSLDESELFKSDLSSLWEGLTQKIIVLSMITNYWNGASWLSIGEITDAEFEEFLAVFLAQMGGEVKAIGNAELNQLWLDYFTYAAEENEEGATTSFASLSGLLLDLIGEDLETIETRFSGG